MLNKRLIIMTGKGGVGKTAVSCALAHWASTKNKKVLLFEPNTKSESEGSFAKFFHIPDVKNEIREIRPNIFLLHADQNLALKNYIIDKLKMSAIYTLLSKSKSIHKTYAFAPGLKELLLLWTLYLHANEEENGKSKYDLIIFDLPPTGHGSFYFKVPQTMIDIMKIGPIAADSKKIQRFFRNRHKTMLNIVTIPEEMPVNESIELAAEVTNNLKIHLGKVFINNILPEVFDQNDIDLIQQEEETTKEKLQSYFDKDEIDALYEGANTNIVRRKMQGSYIDKLNEHFNQCINLTHLYTNEFRIEEIKKLAAELDTQIAP